jgi:hypothetical protein
MSRVEECHIGPPSREAVDGAEDRIVEAKDKCPPRAGRPVCTDGPGWQQLLRSSGSVREEAMRAWLSDINPSLLSGGLIFVAALVVRLFGS